ncbi:molecular chaperone [Enterobacteriaceae endosymbiont of Plateumaris sericea]|uniref:OmpH family outer membrane protein n=1 Tax=Enterobacteriaceae endosymbiont of Plateumaris sericea TaxID=2675797 RepID=UPI00144A2A1F|nr:OmpH family outer membrane protein [Enterobacteriaceae endosymbiont of Plateumaris sericea]QJC29963.1 molecular chaperone [Enterobacteriaceae endosymbiont of Plateumaris sericea]
MKFFLKIFIGLFFTVLSTQTFCCNKIAVVNIAKIFEQIPLKKLCSKQLENDLKPQLIKLQQLQNELNLKIKKIQNQGISMIPSERIKLEKDIKNLRNILIKKVEKFKKENNKRQIEARNVILNHIQKLINIIAKKEHYNIVFDSTFILYIKNVKDITNEVLSQDKLLIK